MLLDGAGAYGLDVGCIHGVAWYANQLGSQVLARVGSHSLPLTDVLGQSIDAVAAMHADACDLRHPGTPSATVVICRAAERAIDYLVLADSVLLLTSPTGEVEAISDTREANVGLTIRTDVDDLPTGTAEHAAATAAYVRALRTHRNVAGGFWVAAADPEAAYEAVLGSCERDELSRAMLLSDGASRLMRTVRPRRPGPSLSSLSTLMVPRPCCAQSARRRNSIQPARGGRVERHTTMRLSPSQPYSQAPTRIAKGCDACAPLPRGVMTVLSALIRWNRLRFR